MTVRTGANRSLAWQAFGLAAAAVGCAAPARAAEVALDRGVVVRAPPGALRNDTGLSVLPATLQDTPQAVNVIPALQLQQQKVVSLEQALRNVPGITVSIGEGGTLNGDQFRIRGQDASNDVYLDGLRDFGVYTRDTFDVQEVQVLKGPSGALFGRGTTGGAINSVSKTAELDAASNVEASAGSAAYYRLTADIDHPLSATAAVRLNLLYNANRVMDRDMVRSARWGVAGSFAAGLGTDTRFTLNYLYQHDDRVPDYGLVIAQPPGSLIAQPVSEYGVPRSNFTGYDTDRDITNANVLTARFSHRASDVLAVTSDGRLGVYDRYFQYTTVDGCPAATCVAPLFDGDPATDPFGTMGGSGPYKQNAWGLQNISTVRYEAPLFGFKSQLIAGFDVSYNANRRVFSAYALPAGVTARNTIPRNLVHANSTPPAGYAVIAPSLANLAGTSATAATVLKATGEATDLGGFVTERLWLAPQWSLMGSVRVDGYRAEYDSLTVGGAYTPVKSNSTLVDPRISLMFEPNRTQTYYLSWGRSATPQGTAVVNSGTAIAATSKDLEPEVNESWEAGAKVGLLGGRLSATAAAFFVRKNNATQNDPSTGFLLAQSGERQEVKGVELGLTGKLGHGWTVNAAYAYVGSRIEESYLACSATAIPCPAGAAASTPVLNTYVIGRQVLLAPKNSGSVFIEHDFGGALNGLSAGGTVTYQDGYPVRYLVATAANVTGLSQLATVPYSLSFDAFAAYEFGRYRVALNAYNLADRLNYSQVFQNRAVPSPGRTLVATVGARF